jgi:hypothetical protein
MMEPDESQVSRLATLQADQVDPFVLTATPSKDAWVDEARPDTNYGADLELTMDAGDQGSDQAFILLDFDLSALPADAAIISATLSVYPSTRTSDDPYAMLPYAVTSTWREALVTWNDQPTRSSRGDPTTLYVGEDWSVFDVTHIIQDWHDGVLSVKGIALLPHPESDASGSRTFEAQETATPPQLAVYYTRRAELTAIKDTWVGAAEPSTPHGTDPVLDVISADHALQEAHALVGFDFESLPDDIAVINASLEMYSQANSPVASSSAADLYANAVLTAWNESTTTWNNAPASHYLNDPPTEHTFNGYTDWDVTQIATNWADGDLDPHGILLRVGPETAYGYGFWSRETSSPPRLVIAYGAAPPDCRPLTSVDVSGVTDGVTGTEYTFEVVLSPADADPPNVVSWQVPDHGRLYGESITVSWDTPGERQLAVVVDQCGGTVSTVHDVVISEPPPGCTVPLERVLVSGPVVVATGSPETYRANVMPSYATDPITFTWRATGQAKSVTSTSASWTEESYSWSEAGRKIIGVTAENCGGAATAYYEVKAVEPADLPDLTISTAWNEADGERTGYVIHNQGDTAVPPGFYVSLEQDSSTLAADLYPSPLEADGIGVGYVDSAWTCPGVSTTVGVLADWAEEVVELDEGNNRWSDVWDCDQQPPSILSGPTVVDITDARARVTWATDEACTSWVAYGTSPYNQPSTEAGSGAYETSHSVSLKGLTGGTTYYVRAFCSDAAGQTVNSEAVPFETEPPGSGPPGVRSLTVEAYDSPFYEFWQATVELEDDAYMDRVTCSLNGDLLGTDYSADDDGAYPSYTVYFSPHELGLGRTEFLSQTQHVSCTAYRQDPTAFTTISEDWTPSSDVGYPIRVWIQEPDANQTLYVEGATVPADVSLDVTAHAAAYEWACTLGGFSEGGVVPPGMEGLNCNDVTAGPVDTVQLWLGGEQRYVAVPGPSELEPTRTIWPEGLGVGTHELRVVARKGTDEAEDSQGLIVEQGEAELEVERSIRREGNTLKITLELHNAGTLPIEVNSIRDNIESLQQVNKTDASGDYVVTTKSAAFIGPGSRRRNVVEIAFPSALTLEPDEVYSVRYRVVPVMFVVGVPAYVGEEAIQVVTNQTTTSQDVVVLDRPGTVVDDPSYGMIPLDDAVANAVRQADYVLVTNPRRVYDVLAISDPDDLAEDLFANVAELAALENGVLGYLSQYGDTSVLDDLIEPGNRWAEALNPVFKEKDDGYVLIVGETEIVAASYAGTSNFVTGAGIPDYVHDTDLYYAHTYGQTARPELVVGRVIGNHLTAMNTYLRRAILAAQGEPGYAFSRSKAYVCNGNGDGKYTFQEDAHEVDGQLEGNFDESIWINFIGDGAGSQKDYHQQYLPNRNLVMYRGHGDVDTWDNGFTTYDILTGEHDFGSTRPGMLAAACRTGNYEAHNDFNIAELLLARGASVYVGATEISERSANSDAFVNFYPKWGEHESMGQALSQVKRKIWNYDWGFDHRKLWAFEYNMYGDPKWGRLTDTQAQSASPTEEETLAVTAAAEGATLKVTLPELAIAEAGPYDRVSIPGGGMLTDPDTYPVPVWSLSVDFPAGERVQDVQITDRGSPAAVGPLSLPVVTPTCDCAVGAHGAVAPLEAALTGWYPPQDRRLEWSVEEAPDGGSTLYVTLYPFTYNADSGDALYYRYHTLAVETLESTARIDSVDATPSSGGEPGRPVTLDVVVSRTGRPADVIIQGSVRTRGTNHLLGGLPLITLHNLTGSAMADLTWDTRPYGAGDYQVVLELLDTQGRLLDTAVEEVQLGTHGARLTGLTASETTFSPGDAITLTMGVQNTGTVPISGTAVFLVQHNPGLTLTQMITAPVEALAPGRMQRIDVIWDSTDAKPADYRVLGYVKFLSQTTEPLVVALSSPRIYLPLVMRD